jgi:hypothetical protein
MGIFSPHQSNRYREGSASLSVDICVASKNECNPLIPRIRTSSPVRSHLLAGTMNDRVRSSRLRHDFHISGLEAARWSVFKYFDTFCNPVRLHQSLGYKKFQRVRNRICPGPSGVTLGPAADGNWWAIAVRVRPIARLPTRQALSPLSGLSSMASH